MKTLHTHLAVACAGALLGSVATYFGIELSAAQAQPAPAAGTRQIELFKTTMNDVMGRVVTVRRTERDPGSGTPPHRHPGSHTFGYILEGVYEFRLDDGPVQRLLPGQTFYEPPNALHAVSRNGSASEVVKYLVIQVSDPTLPATVLEK